MRMRPGISVIGLVALSILAAPVPAQEGVKASVGRWKLNVARSTFEGAPLRSQNRLYEEWSGGVIHGRFEGIDAQGKPTLSEYAARFDGKEYPRSMTNVAVLWTISLKPVDARTFSFVIKENGRVAQEGTHTVSADGKTMTVEYKATTADGKPNGAKLVLEREP